MKANEVLSHFEKRIKELNILKEKGLKRDIAHLVEHSLQINEILYLQELQRQGKIAIGSTSKELQ